MKHYALIMLGVLFLLGAAVPDRTETPLMCGSPTSPAPQKEKAMYMEDLENDTTTIPPIDRAVPAKLETAAFGLG